MAKRTGTVSPSLPATADLTPAQMRVAISKLERRVAELKAFDATLITNGGDPEVLALEASIRQALESMFGNGSTQFNLYQSAFDLDTTTYRISLGGHGGTTTQEYERV